MSPANQLWECDRRTDRQTDDGQSYPYVSQHGIFENSSGHQSLMMQVSGLHTGIHHKKG